MEGSISSARDEDERRKNYIESLELSVNALGYNILKNVSYDGNCFYNAIAELPNESGVELRKCVTEFIKQEVKCMNHYHNYLFKACAFILKLLLKCTATTFHPLP